MKGKLIDCPECGGTGAARTKRTKRSIHFDLTKPCATCAGTGKALVSRRTLYVGRPDLKPGNALATIKEAEKP